ncbi:glutaredoxin family protein [Litorivivens sp.]|uniref:glutaredoxin family protein n=1 Tax=Litorivivens sp. TaxID=2020868 RepID=UPI0035667638
MAVEKLILYGTSACHLCELAEALLVELQSGGLAFTLEKVDIADDDTLMERYGIVIPVVRRSNGSELGWPFDAQAVVHWLAAA